MWDFFLSLVQVNESINYTLIISVIFAYFLLIWFVVCVWVFFDAHKRHRSVAAPIFFALFALLFGLPALIFYIMIRPEHTLEEDYYMGLALSGEKEMRPIYFDGDKGFDVSLNISVQPKVGENGKHRMELDMAWVPQKVEMMQEKKRRARSRSKSQKSMSEFLKKLKGYWSNFSRNINSELSFISKKAKANKKKKKVVSEREREEGKNKKEENVKKPEKASDLSKDKSKKK